MLNRKYASLTAHLRVLCVIPLHHFEMSNIDDRMVARWRRIYTRERKIHRVNRELSSHFIGHTRSIHAQITRSGNFLPNASLHSA